MKTSIVLTDNKSIYHPGDKIKGHVKISAPSSADVERIIVSLRGLANTHIVFVKYWHSQSNFKRQVQLFSQTIPVFNGPYTIKPGDHEWPFEFTLPEQCEKHESQEFDDKKSLLFDDDADQDLPPALNEFTSKNFNTSGNSYSISYPLTASVFVDKTLGSKQDDTVQNLNIQPYRELEHPTWRTVTQACKFSTWLGNMPAANKRRSSIFKRRGSVQAETNFDFSLHAKVATIVIPGRPIPVFFSIQHDSPPADMTIPKFIIKSISVTLNSDNIIRSKGSHQQFYLSGSPESKWTETTPVGTKLETSIPIELGDTLDIRNLMKNFMIPPETTVSFFSFSICILHEMKFNLEIECNGQSFTAMYSQRVIVLSPYFKPDVLPVKEDQKLEVPVDHETDGRNDSFADARPDYHGAPPSFGAAMQEAGPLPGYSKDGTY